MRNFVIKSGLCALVLVFTCGFMTFPAESLKITWKDLQDVRFRKKINKDDGMIYLYPEFGPKVKGLEGKEIEIRGFMIPIDPTGQLIVLSANPMASCFFCGAAGPASIIQLKLIKPRRFRMDETLTIKGTLKLNPDNVEELNYIMENAEVVNKPTQ